MEVLGTYDPVPKPAPFGEGKPFKDIKLDTARAKYWLGVGAQPSDPAWRLLSMVSDVPKPSMEGQGGEILEEVEKADSGLISNRERVWRRGERQRNRKDV